MQTLRDPLHRHIPLEPWAVGVIDTPQVQRLRRIRQLGTAHLVYPGANHTRFEHGLGAHKLAQDATRSFGLDPDDARTVQAAALLHDVGHGPLSHLFEEAMEAEKVHHEELSVALIRDSTIAERLEEGGIDPHRVADLVAGRGHHARLVAGDIDVDRMDYLLRDAYYTGLRVGVDPERLLDTLALEDGHVVVREEGITAVEALLVARFLMYPMVYFHHTVRASEAMLMSATRRVVADGAATVADLRLLDDAQFFGLLAALGGYTADIAERIQERRLFKRAWEGTFADVEAHPLLSRASTDAGARTRIENELAQGAGLEEGQVLIDAPRLTMAREVEARVLQRDGSLVPLKQRSTLTRNLAEAQRDHWRAWVFAPRERLDEVSAALAQTMEPKRVKHGPGFEPRP